MAVFCRGLCAMTFLVFVSQVVCGIDRSFNPDRRDVEEFQISSNDGEEFTEDLDTDRIDDTVDDVEGNSSRIISTLRVNNGGRWGDWGPVQLCPDGSYAVGYDMKIEPKKRVDNTALNAIKLICEYPNGNVSGEVTSTQGRWGSWVGPVKCKHQRDFLSSFDLQVEKYRGRLRDDTAANYVKFTCRNSCKCRKPYGLVKPPGHGIWGTWGAWSAQCPTYTAICGIKTKVEKPQGSFRDDTALNDVLFYCCI